MSLFSLYKVSIFNTALSIDDSTVCGHFIESVRHKDQDYG